MIASSSDDWPRRFVWPSAVTSVSALLGSLLLLVSPFWLADVTVAGVGPLNGPESAVTAADGEDVSLLFLSTAASVVTAESLAGFTSGAFCGAPSVIAFRCRVTLVGVVPDWANAPAVNSNAIVRTSVLVNSFMVRNLRLFFISSLRPGTCPAGKDEQVRPLNRPPGIHRPPRPSRIVLIVSNMIVASSVMLWFLM